MAWTDSIPAVGNDIASDIPAIANNFAYLKALRMPGFFTNLKLDVYATNMGYACASAVLTTGNDDICLTGFAGTLDMTTTGADALDAGTIAAGTTYYIYLIYNGTNKKALASTSATAPTMPTGYTYKLLVGAFKTQSGDATFPLSSQRGNVVLFETAQEVSSYDSNNPLFGWTDQDCSEFIPATMVDRGYFYGTLVSGYDTAIKIRKNGSSGNGLYVCSAHSTAGMTGIGSVWCDMDTDRIVEISIAQENTWVFGLNGYVVNI